MQVLQLEMERLSLNKAAPNDKNAKSRLSLLDMELSQLKKDQKEITDKWQAEKREMSRVQVCAEKGGGGCKSARCVVYLWMCSFVGECLMCTYWTCSPAYTVHAVSGYTQCLDTQVSTYTQCLDTHSV
jgi:hypothetical protein